VQHASAAHQQWVIWAGQPQAARKDRRLSSETPDLGRGDALAVVAHGASSLGAHGAGRASRPPAPGIGSIAKLLGGAQMPLMVLLRCSVDGKLQPGTQQVRVRLLLWLHARSVVAACEV
jgi:hypothetical protein